MEIILIMVVAVYVLAIAIQLKGYRASIKVPKAAIEKLTLEACSLAQQESM
jgi:hypothetical protein